MNTLEVPERNIKVEFPSSWEEMSNSQFEFVIKTWIKLMDGKINEDEFMLIVLYNFLGIERGPFQDWKDRRLSRQQLEDKFANVWQLTETLSWLIRIEETEEGPVGFLDWSEINQRFYEIENPWGVKLIGMADGILDITFGEYRRAWACFEAYSRDHKHIDLDRLMAVLFLPERDNFNEIQYRPDFDGRRRELFNPYLNEHYAELMKDIPFWQKYAGYQWFGNCDKWLKEGELEMDGKIISFAPLFSKNKQVDDQDLETMDENDLGLTGLLYMIAESKLFGTPEQVDKTGYLEILTALLYWKQQTDKIKKP